MKMSFTVGGIQMNAFDLIRYAQRQAEFSQRTFGPGTRFKGIMQHIRKELKEIEDAPEDCEEWADVIILALDGALRQGHSPEHICQVLEAKYQKNSKRAWPDWQTMSQDEAITHIKPAVQS